MLLQITARNLYTQILLKAKIGAFAFLAFIGISEVPQPS
jgi:hypothetical protein